MKELKKAFLTILLNLVAFSAYGYHGRYADFDYVPNDQAFQSLEGRRHGLWYGKPYYYRNYYYYHPNTYRYNYYSPYRYYYGPRYEFNMETQPYSGFFPHRYTEYEGFVK